MRKPCKVRNRTGRTSSDFLVAAELLERRYAFTATPFSDEFVSAAMEAVARGEITSDRWIVHEINNLGSSNNQVLNLTNFGGNAGWHADPIGDSFFRLRTSGISNSDVVNWARNNQDSFLVEPDLPVQVETSSNDPSLWRLYGLNNYGQTGGTSDADIDATEAWDITTGSHDVVIGVIDSGVDITHPDLAANIWVNPGETPNNGIDDDGNGFIDDVNGWDFYDDDNSPNDGNGHGTHVAGTIGAVGNNNLGITGVNWQVSLLPLRFIGNDGSGWTSDAVAAVNYATMLKRDFGISVAATNNSWGGGGYSRTLDRAIQVANDEGIMFIAAAGNQGTNNDTNPSYPTNYTSPNVISVAALNRNDNLASFSNYGATTVDVGAPGVSIYSTLPGNSYGSLSGTSMAAPHVAGVVGLLNAAKPGISVTEVTNAIFDSVDPLQSLNGKTLTGGRVNAASALTSLLGQPPSIDPIDNLVINSDKILNISVTASDIDGDVTLSLVVSESTTEEPPATVTLDGSALTITPIKGRYGAITVSLIATDEQSNTATTSFTVDTLQAVESEGAVTLNKDSFGKFYADDMPIYNSAGSHIGEDTSSLQAGWNIGGVETVNGTNRMLVYRDGDAHYWELNSTWQYQSHSNFYVDGTAQYFDVETQFQVDINNDETIGAPALILEAVESEGAVTLNKDSFGKFYADDMPIYNSAGSHIGEDTSSLQAGWNIGGVETVNGTNRMLVYRDGDAHYWELNSTWQYQSHSNFYVDGTAQYFDVETQFQVDINNDETIGAPALILEAVESEGAVTLNKDSFGKFYADDMPIYNSAGSHIGEDTSSLQAGWNIGGVETVNGTNRMLVYRDGDAHYWELNSTWQYQSHSNFYVDGTAQYFDVETQFQVDINNDETIGQPITKELQAFPSSILPGNNFTNLPSGYETSGLVLHEGFNKLFTVSDGGILSVMNPNGTGLVHWSLAGDFEAITVADHESDFIYIGVENPDSIIEFNVSSGEITRTFSLTNWMTGPGNLGLEALTFVPDISQPEGGYFYAGLQSSGTIYRFELPINSSTDSTTVTFIDTLQVEGNHTDISGLTYDPSSDRILALYDSINRIKVIERNGDLRTQWVAPGSEQEAIFYAQGELFIGEDFGSMAQGIITKYSPFTLIVG